MGGKPGVERPDSDVLCLCGCGRPTKFSVKTGRPNRYLKGHSTWSRLEVLCECGCGKPVRYSEQKEDWPKRLPGHNRFVEWRRELKKQKQEWESAESKSKVVLWWHSSEQPVFCGCGCREIIKLRKKTKKRDCFVDGHQSKSIVFWFHPVTNRCYVRKRDFGVYPWSRILYCNEHTGGVDLPPGIDVHHIDKNSMNDALSNLEAITRAEHEEKHGWKFKKRRKAKVWRSD